MGPVMTDGENLPVEDISLEDMYLELKDIHNTIVYEFGNKDVRGRVDTMIGDLSASIDEASRNIQSFKIWRAFVSGGLLVLLLIMLFAVPVLIRCAIIVEQSDIASL